MTSKGAWETAVLKAHGYAPAKGKPLRDAKDNCLTPAARRAYNDLNLHWHDLRHHAEHRIMPRPFVRALLS